MNSVNIITSRFPLTAAGWRNSSDHYILSVRMPVGTHSYEAVLGRAGPFRVRECFLQLHHAYPEDFASASRSLSAPSWRLAYFTPSLAMSHLLDPCFDPSAALVSHQSREWLRDIPVDWFDSQSTPDLGIDQLRIELGNLTMDQAKAAWVILSFARAIPLEVGEVAGLKWWILSWLLGFAEHASDPEPPI